MVSSGAGEMLLKIPFIDSLRHLTLGQPVNGLWIQSCRAQGSRLNTNIFITRRGGQNSVFQNVYNIYNIYDTKAYI